MLDPTEFFENFKTPSSKHDLKRPGIELVTQLGWATHHSAQSVDSVRRLQRRQSLVEAVAQVLSASSLELVETRD